ncbi:septal ring lytic transglycosylase RlpA family protein [Thermodesulfobacteriota bacterium]
MDTPTPPDTIPVPETKMGKIPEPYVVFGKRYYPLPDSHGFVQYGKASWYGKKFHGRRTSSGEIYDMHKRTAAHKTLPLGTYVKVTRLSTKKYAIVRINDRGPFVKGRVIDLSYAVARELDVVGPGVVDVKVVALGKEVGTRAGKQGTTPLVKLEDLKTGNFTIQVGAFQERENALKLAEGLRDHFEYVRVSVYVDENKRTLHRVHVSKTNTLSSAGEMEKRLEDMGFRRAFIVRM